MPAPDRRRDRRFTPDRQLPVKIRADRRGSVVRDAIVLDLSARGLRLSVDGGHGYTVGEPVLVFFAPSNGNLSAGIQGECVEAEVVSSPTDLTVHLQADQLAALTDPDYQAYLQALDRLAS